jgi:hypothetical protein
MVLSVEEDVRVKGNGACDCLNHEEIDRQYEVCARPDQKHRNEEERCVVALISDIRPRNKMIFAIVSVMKLDVIVKKQTAPWMVGEPAMHQRLGK